MTNQPKPPSNSKSVMDEILKAFNQTKISPEQKEARFKAQMKYNRAINMLYTTEYGEIFINNLVAYCKWDSIYNYKQEDRAMIQVQQEFIREMILSRLTPENLTKVFHFIRKGEK